MPQVTFTQYDGTKSTIEGAVGDSVMQVAVRNGISAVVAECGGVLSCATCHVFVDPADSGLFDAPSEAEEAMLEGTAVDCEPNSRLSCQLVLTNDIVEVRVALPEYQD
jgi:2Fe-2S ferredoxin